MLFDVFSFNILGSVILTGITIKLIDDYLDNDKTIFSKIIENMGKGILPYSIIIFSISCLLNLETSVSLVSSAYIVGMISDFNRKLTFNLKGYEESILIFIILVIFLGFNEMVSSLIIIFITQLIDDIIDINKDKYYNNKNLAFKLGVVESILISVILVLITLKIDALKLVICLIVFLLIEFLEYSIKWEDKKWI